LLEFLSVKLKEHDADKSVKVSIFRCLTAVLKNCELEESRSLDYLTSMSNKLKVEIEKGYIVETIGWIRKSGPEKAKLIEVIIRQLS
jgi:hypothetical protein